MIDRLTRACAERPAGTVLVAAAAAALGLLAWQRLPHDVLPPLSDARVTVITDWMGHPAGDVERLITAPIDRALGAVGGVVGTLGQSMMGMSVVDLQLGPGADLERVRDAVSRRLRTIGEGLPPGARWVVGSGADATGWVLQYALVDRRRQHDRGELTAWQRQHLAPILGALPGVAEVATIGGQDDELRIEADAGRLLAAGETLESLATAVREALPFAAAASADDARGLLGSAALSDATVSDLATLRVAPRMAPGFADLDGVLDAVGGVVVARRGADVRGVLGSVRAVLDRVRPSLPAGVEIVTVYDRGDVLARMDRTLWRAVIEEVVMVALVVALFLRQRRAVLVPVVTLPAVVLLTGLGLWLLAVPATVVSLAGLAIALGLGMDAEIVMLEAGEQRLATLGLAASADERRQAVLHTASTVTPAVVVALLIAAAGFLPALAFAGETGRLLTPLVLGEGLVVLGAALAAVTLAPALRSRLLGNATALHPGRLSAWLQAIYRPLVHVALRSPRVTLTLGAVAVLSCLPLLARLGGEFLPEIDEGTLLFMPTTRGDVEPHEAAAVVRAVDALLTRQPGVASAFGKVGRAETATDPAPYSMAEVTVILGPPSQRPTVAERRWWSPAPFLAPILRPLWPERRSMRAAELALELDRQLTIPGWTNAWTQPVRGRIGMVATSLVAPVAARIAAASTARIDELGRRVAQALGDLPGTRAAAYQPSGGGAEWTLEPIPSALGRHDLDDQDVQRTLRTARDGIVAGVLQDVPVVVSYPPEQLRLGPGLAQVPVAPGVALGAVARLVLQASPIMLRLEDGHRVGYVPVELAPGRDPVRYVEQARRAVAGIALHPGETLEWTGQYRLAASGRSRLVAITLGSLALVFGLLWWQLRRLVEVLIVLASVPFALVGSVWALHLLGYALSPAVWVGMLSLVGLATQTGIVMVVYIDVAFFGRLRRGLIRTPEDILIAHAEGTIARVRPKVMTLTAMAAGLCPLLWSEGPGAEIVRRVAAPMLGGLVTSAFLTLELVPVLYTMWRTRQLDRARREGRPLAEIVGPPPRWSGV